MNHVMAHHSAFDDPQEVLPSECVNGPRRSAGASITRWNELGPKRFGIDAANWPMRPADRTLRSSKPTSLETFQGRVEQGADIAANQGVSLSHLDLFAIEYGRNTAGSN